MSLDWLRRDNEMKDHGLFSPEHWGSKLPGIVYEKRPPLDEATFEAVLGKPTE